MKQNSSERSRMSTKIDFVFKSCSVLVIVLVCNISFASAISLDDELTITYSQKVALDKVP